MFKPGSNSRRCLVFVIVWIYHLYPFRTWHGHKDFYSTAGHRTLCSLPICLHLWLALSVASTASILEDEKGLTASSTALLKSEDKLGSLVKAGVQSGHTTESPELKYFSEYQRAHSFNSSLTWKLSGTVCYWKHKVIGKALEGSRNGD